MTKPIARDPIYRQRAFDADITQLCVRWYVTYQCLTALRRGCHVMMTGHVLRSIVDRPR